MTVNNANKTLIAPELSYRIVGASFNVFNELGWGLSEKRYQLALAQEFAKLGIPFQREVYIPLKYKGENAGRCFADFVIGNRNILLELKVVQKLGYVHVRQVLDYLQCGEIKLGILLYFTKDGVKYRRVLNPKV